LAESHPSPYPSPARGEGIFIQNLFLLILTLKGKGRDDLVTGSKTKKAASPGGSGFLFFND